MLTIEIEGDQKTCGSRLARVAFVINPKTAPFYNYYLRAAEPLSQALGIELCRQAFGWVVNRFGRRVTAVRSAN
jgi:hypothetical protein